MDFPAFSPPTQTGPWHDSFAYDSSDAGSAETAMSRQESGSGAAEPLPNNSFALSKRRSRKRQGPVHDRARERIRELEQRVRELESSASETTARATIKVLQTRVRDLEAEVDCLSMRLEHAELAMSRTRAGEPSIPQNLFSPMMALSTSAAPYGTQADYITALPNQAQATTIPYGTTMDQMMSHSAPSPSDSTIPRSGVRPLINWSIPSMNPQRPDSASAQRPGFVSQPTAIWRGP